MESMVSDSINGGGVSLKKKKRQFFLSTASYESILKLIISMCSYMIINFSVE